MVAALAACSSDGVRPSVTGSPEESSTSSSATTSSTSTVGSPSPTFTECPITSPIGELPEELEFERPVPWVRQDSGWYGNSALWVSLPPDGVLPALSNGADGLLETKFPWWRISPGELEIQSNRPADDQTLSGSAPDGYGPDGFNPSFLVFSDEGCWEVMGTVAGETLSFTVWVCETSSISATVTQEEREACGAI